MNMSKNERSNNEKGQQKKLNLNVAEEKWNLKNMKDLSQIRRKIEQTF